MTASACPSPTRLFSAFRSVSRRTTITRLWLIVVWAWVGPRPVYSRISRTTELLMAWAVLPRDAPASGSVTTCLADVSWGGWVARREEETCDRGEQIPI